MVKTVNTRFRESGVSSGKRQKRFWMNTGFHGTGRVLAFLLFSLLCTSGVAWAQTDREVLEVFYVDTGGGSWTKSDNWSSNIPAATNLNDLYGVTADSNGRVTELRLQSNQLSGTIPTELGQLTGLEKLYLSVNNQLSGTIPTELGQLSSLTRLNFSYNQLSGTIPTEFGQLPKLEWLYFPGNQLTGTIPTELGQLTGLTQLRLNENQLTGTIPSELGSLTGLTLLYLWGNELSGTIPTELGDLSNMKQLSLSGNQLSGTIPTELGDLSNLQQLYLNRNQLTGTIPSELGSLAGLTWLYLWGNELSGTIPTELGDLSNLQGLSLSQNQLSGTIPTELGDLSNLQQLYLNRNQLTGTIPSELGSLAGLTWLYLWGNELSGTIPTELGQLTNLTNLYLQDNQITGTIPTELGDLSNLQQLYLNRNQLTGTIPSELGSLAGLTWLYLWGNELSGTIPTELGQLTNLTNLYLQDNQITGTIPTELGDLSNLQQLYLNRNQLTGTIPSELGSLAGLTWLYLWGNELSGTIPTELEALANANLQELALWSNGGLMGSIPSELGKRVDRAVLRALYDANGGKDWTNKFNWFPIGEEPELIFSFGNWHGVAMNSDGRVSVLYLANNNLSGEITDALEALEGFQTLNLSGNRSLGGTLPVGLMDLPGLHTVNIQCTGIRTPTDSGFQAWLGTINFTGSRCPSFSRPRPPAPEPIDPSQDDMEELRVFYLETGGENWADNTNWLSEDEPLSQWYGVSVNSQGRVTGVDLPGNGLSGSVPPSLGHSVSELKTLDLSDNPMLTGMLPLSLMNLSELGMLNIEGTGMCAPDDAEFQQWLGTIDFQGNTCADDVDGLGLEAFYLTTGGENWTDNTNWLVDGKPPSQWYGVSVDSQGRVTGIDLSDNGLSGSVPPSLGHSVSELKTLDLSDNPMLTGTLPLSLMNLSKLQALNIEGTGACAPDDAEFQRWLETIDFREDNCVVVPPEKPEEPEMEESDGGACAIAGVGNTPENAVFNLLLIMSALLAISWRRPSGIKRI